MLKTREIILYFETHECQLKQSSSLNLFYAIRFTLNRSIELGRYIHVKRKLYYVYNKYNVIKKL